MTDSKRINALETELHELYEELDAVRGHLRSRTARNKALCENLSAVGDENQRLKEKLAAVEEEKADAHQQLAYLEQQLEGQLEGTQWPTSADEPE